MRQRTLKNIPSQHGFTLVELILYMGILSILLLVVTEVFTYITKSAIESESVSAVTYDTQYIFNRLAYDFERAQFITSPIQNGDSDSSVTILIDGAPHTYTLNGNVLELSDSNSTTRVHSALSEVTNFTVQRIGNTNGTATVKITYTVRSIADENPETKTLTSTLGVRTL